jgi:hypothetical protein
MHDAQTESVVDRRVQARLASDRDYLAAENAEEQALAERKIELQEERAVLTSRAALTPSEQMRVEDIDTELKQVYAELKAL